MARMSNSSLTKLKIIRVGTKQFLEQGYSATTAKSVASVLNISPGNLTFHFPSKEHLLAELTDLLCRFQWELMKKEAEDGVSSVMAACLELTAMAAACEEDEIAKDFYLSAYTGPLCMAIIRKNDAARAKTVFASFCSDWTDEQFDEAEILVSGIEYATLMTAGADVPLETRISGALNQILSIYGVPEETRKAKIGRVLRMDYRTIGRRTMSEFKQFVEQANEQALLDLLKI